jgi:hypothetical protein
MLARKISGRKYAVGIALPQDSQVDVQVSSGQKLFSLYERIRNPLKPFQYLIREFGDSRMWSSSRFTILHHVSLSEHMMSVHPYNHLLGLVSMKHLHRCIWTSTFPTQGIEWEHTPQICSGKIQNILSTSRGSGPPNVDSCRHSVLAFRRLNK